MSGYRLEQYTLRYPQEVLLVTWQPGAASPADRQQALELAPEQVPEQVVIFKGFSSSLSGSTATDPEVPVIPANAHIVAVERLQAPYQPDQPHYLEQQIPWLQFEQRLVSLGL